METKWIHESGKRILIVDFRGARNEEDFMKLLDEEVAIQTKETQPFFVVSNFEGTTIPSKFRDAAAKLVNQDFRKNVVKEALVGIVGIKKIIFNGFQALTGAKNIQAFETENEAMDWLLK